jgi:hypothetical protein
VKVAEDVKCRDTKTVLEAKLIAYQKVARLGVQPKTDVMPPSLKAHECVGTGIS